MKKVFVFLLLLHTTTAVAGDLQLGLNVGPAFVRNADFNGQNAKTGIHLMAGFNVAYSLDCQSRFCQGLFLEPGFAFTFPATTNFGSTRVASTGVLGNYSESLKIYSGAINLKKHFRAGRRLTVFALGGIGISYFQISNSRFTDALGTAQTLNVSESSLNPNINLGLGIAYEASAKLLISIGLVPHIVFTSIADQSYMTLPLGINYAF